jgi:hypothetical protein
MWKIFKILLSITASLAGYLEDKQLIEAGKDKAENRELRKVLENVKKAREASKRLDDDMRNRLREKYNRY